MSEQESPASKDIRADNPVFAFQKEFPSDCPPADAKPVEGIFYACHKNSPPSGEDFTTSAQRNVNRGKCECKRRSHSILRDVDDARGLVEKYKKMFSYISRGRLQPHHGALAETGHPGSESHCSFWRFANVSMVELFDEQI